MDRTEEAYIFAIKTPIEEKGEVLIGATQIDGDLYEMNLNPKGTPKWIAFSLKKLLEMASEDEYKAEAHVPAGNFITISVSKVPVINATSSLVR